MNGLMKAGSARHDWRFLSARSLASLSRLPRFQDLPSGMPRPREEFRHLVFVSHRWEAGHEADPEGTQLAAIKRLIAEVEAISAAAHCQDGLGIEQHGPVIAAHLLFRTICGGGGNDLAETDDVLDGIGVWYDFSCLPQAPRTIAEDEVFARSMPGLPELLGARDVTTLILRRDGDCYDERAWCFTEAVLADRKSDTNRPLQYWPERWSDQVPGVRPSDSFLELIERGSPGMAAGGGSIGWSNRLSMERCMPATARILAELLTLEVGEEMDVAAAASRLLPVLGLRCLEERDSIMIPLMLTASSVAAGSEEPLAIIREAADRFVARLPLRLERREDGFHWQSPPEPPREAEWPVFISYRRSPLTGEIAKWLKEQLQEEPILSLNDQWFRLKVFVDSLEPVHGDFQSHLVPHLKQSRMLVVLADQGAAVRHPRPKRDFLYEELDWWAEHRPKTSPVILEIDRVSAGKLIAGSPAFSSWATQSRLECYWEEWRGGPPGTLGREKERMLRVLRESIRIYGHQIHLAEVRRLRRLVHRLVGAVIAVLLAGAAAAWLAFELKESLAESEARAYALAVNGSQASIKSGDYAAARSALAAAPDSLRGWEWGYLRSKADGALVRLSGHPGGAKAVVFGAGDTTLLSVGADGYLRVWDPQSGEAIRGLCPIPDRGPPPGDAEEQAAVISAGAWPAGPPALGVLAVSRDGNRAAAGGSQGQVVVWETRDWKSARLLKAHSQHVQSLAFLNSNQLLSLGQEGHVKQWDLSVSPAHGGLLHDFGTPGLAALSPDGSRLAFCRGEANSDAGAPSRVDLFALDGRGGMEHLRGGRVSGDIVADMAYLGDRPTLVVADFQGRLAFIEEGDEPPVVVRAVPEDRAGFLPLGAVAASPDGALVASGDKTGVIKLWDAESKELKRVLAGHDGNVGSLAFSRSGGRLASASADGSVRIWDVTRRGAVNQSVPLEFDGWAMALHPDGKSLVVAGSDGQMRLLDLNGDALEANEEEADNNQSVLCYSPDGSSLLSIGNYGGWMIRDATTLEPRMVAENAKVAQGFFSGDGRVVVLLDDGSVQVRDRSGGSPLPLIAADEGNPVTAIASAGSANVVVVGRKDGALTIMDLCGNTAETLPDGLKHPDHLVAFTQVEVERIAAVAGTTVAWWSRGWTGYWRLDHKVEKAHEELVRALVFSPDGRRLVSGSEDQTCRIWDLQTGMSLLQTDAAGGIVHSLAFGPDGRELIIGSCEEKLHILRATHF